MILAIGLADARLATGLADARVGVNGLVDSHHTSRCLLLLALPMRESSVKALVACPCYGIAGALAARPPSYESFKVSQCFMSNGLSTCFVSMSAGFSAPGTFTSLKSPFLMRSCIRRSAVAKCRTLPSPLQRQIPIAAVASVRTVKFRAMPKSQAMVWRPRPWAAPLEIPVNSASAELSATVA